MEPTQKRIDRETPRAAGRSRPIVYLTVPAIAVLVLGVHAVYAACFTPAPGTFTTSGTLELAVGGSTITCQWSMTIDVPAPPGNCNPPDPLCIPASKVSFKNCSNATAGVHAIAALAARGTWALCLSSDGTTSKTFIPQGGATATSTVLGSNCAITVAPNGSATVSGSWNNTSSSASFSNQSVPVATSGAFPCPVATTGSFSGTLTASPALVFH